MTKFKVMLSSSCFSWFVIVAGIVLMTFGAMVRGEHLTVLNKAIRICMECIGIG